MDRATVPQSEVEFLQQYEENGYENPFVSVDIIVLSIAQGQQNSYRKLPDNKLQLLLIKRKNPPYQDYWALPGGFIDMDEMLKEGAKRALFKETGLQPNYFGQLYTWSRVKRDPRARVIGTSYLAMVNKKSKHIRAGDDASEVKWFDITCRIEGVETHEREYGLDYQWYVRIRLDSGEEKLSSLIRITRQISGSTIGISRELIENDGLAFDHAMVIEHGIEKFRHKIQYTDLVFKLVPEFFTLTQLQKVYETALDKKIPRASFRRNIADKVLETEEYITKGGHRPSQLFTFNPHWLYKTLQEGIVDLWS